MLVTPFQCYDFCENEFYEFAVVEYSKVCVHSNHHSLKQWLDNMYTTKIRVYFQYCIAHCDVSL